MSRSKKTESTEKKERAIVSRERRLALALVAILDANRGIGSAGGEELQAKTEAEASELLFELGYGSLKSIHTQVAILEEELADAIRAKDYPHVSELGKELEKARLGKSSGVVKEE